MGSPIEPPRRASFERLAQVVIALVALACVGNGLVIMLKPMGWYEALPSVKATGAANHHLIVDVGLAYLSSGLLLAYGAWSPSIRSGALTAGILWLAAHGASHLIEFLTGAAPLDRFLVDAPAVLAPPLVVIGALVLARPRIQT